ncbi:MAG TPA: hypothetical protein VEA37_10950, partial [Flavobacterium sp.]|nr:hypothetical protein [Flavobacterium sp.]
VVSTDCPTGPREILNVPDLEHDPITRAIRTPVGTLLPLLQDITDDIAQQWTNEIRHWLHCTPPSESEFKALTNRFTLDTLLGEWQQVIEH